MLGRGGRLRVFEHFKPTAAPLQFRADSYGYHGGL